MTPERGKLPTVKGLSLCLLGTATVVLVVGCGSAVGTPAQLTSGGETVVLTPATVTVRSQTTPHQWGDAFAARARIAIGRGRQGNPTAVSCSSTITIMLPGHRTRTTALCTAITDSTCGEWFAYRQNGKLVTSLWRYRQLAVCRRKAG
jgi:hypothetical protein